MGDRDLVTIKDLILLVETEKAMGCIHSSELQERVKPQVQHWFPKSQIARRTMDGFGEVGEIDIPRWLAEKTDLEYEE